LESLGTPKVKLKLCLAFLGLALPAFPQNPGPAVLSRGEVPSGMSLPELRFTPFLALSGTYSTGLADVGTTPTGDLASESSLGLKASWGLSGAHSWKFSRLGLTYTGGYSRYLRRSAYDSTDHSLLLGFTHRLSPRTTINLRQSAGTFSRNPGMLELPQTAPFDPSQTFIPTTDFFDNRTYHLSSQADLVYRKSARLSFNLGGDLFLSRRRSSALNGNNGIMARGDMQYRYSRRITLGMLYNFAHFSYTRTFGGTDAHAVAGAFGIQLSRTVELSGYAGALRAESMFIQQVPIDPVIASLLGISTGSQIVHTVLYEPNVAMRLSRTFRYGVAYLSAGHTVTPGNGLFLTSSATSVRAGYGYTGLRWWSLSAYSAYSWSKAVGPVQGKYGTLTGSVNGSRQLVRSLHFMASYAIHRYDSPVFGNYNRIIHSASAGLAFAPGDVPLRVW
jgi:hypothetical protein